ncbi:MAG: tetraacyldisaccharide 4'-kinase [Myxococcota bacterium]|nr:tetraacyldisaccharide 4'-kinase [Myxococcota bacterium]
MKLAWAASIPYQQASGIRRRQAALWPALPRPTISVGNIAFGGRGKTPVSAALAQAAQRRGLRPALLARGYRSQLSRRSEPVLLRGSTGLPWLQATAQHSERAGDEPSWLAAVCPDLLVGVHPDRVRSAEAILEQQAVDLFILDDGFQTPVQRDVDLVLLEARLDPPFTSRTTPLRDAPSALARATVIGVFGPLSSPWPAAWKPRPVLPLRRYAQGLRLLESGEAVAPDTVRQVIVAAGVGQPASVERIVEEAGITVVDRLRLRDHGAPSRRDLLRATAAGIPLLVTEKDAIGWAGCSAPPNTLVVELGIEGIDRLCDKALDALPPAVVLSDKSG